jgi:LuxR family maltose regulon positive regulatory protein
MDLPLLQTKLHIPPLRPERVPRPRLIARLDEGLRRGHKLALLSAPAGSGKTTLLSEWIAARGQEAAWLSLDATDNEPARFWAYAIAALRTVQPGLGEETLALLQAPQLPPISSALIPLLNQIAVLADPLVLVLDDYHVISTPALHQGIAFVLEHAPRQLHLVLSTRADPPLPVSRLRARGRLTELRADDLRFTPGEATAFLRDVTGLGLEPAEVDALKARTEGWIVGLQLAALSMQGRDAAGREAFLSSFAGSHHYILEYLTEEVLDRQPEPVRQFLLRTSILDRLCGALCDAVTGQEGSGAVLAALQRDNLFVVPLDDAHRWYRYHHLFADLLGNLLRQALPTERIRELHRRASLWYEGESEADAAIRHALGAEDSERAASLIEAAVATALSRGEVATLLHWIEALPRDLVLARPRLCMYLGWSTFLNGQYVQSEQALDAAGEALQAMPPSSEQDALRGELGAMLATIATLHHDVPAAMAHAQEALAHLPEERLAARARASRALGIAYGLAGDTDRLIEECGWARSLALASGNRFLASEVISQLAFMRVHQGRLRQAAASYQEIIDLAAHPSRFPPACLGYIGLAAVALERNDLDATQAYLDRGIELSRRGGIGYALRPAFCTQAILSEALGDSESADAAMDRAIHLPWIAGSGDIATQLAQYQVRLQLLRGDVEAAARWATGDALDAEAPVDRAHWFEHLPPVLHEVHQVALAQAYLAQGDLDGVLAAYDRICEAASAAGRMARVIEISLLAAVALLAQGKLEAAMVPFERCLALAAPEGYVRLFMEAGPLAITLLTQARDRGRALARTGRGSTGDDIQTYTDELLATLGAATPETGHPATARRRAQLLVEPLSDRERQVLRLIGEGYSNQRVADTLYVSINTVKKHASSIYGKLGVSSRTQAVARAQELGLL